MYATCTFCHASLGTNESIEHFPTGRCLAYDAARGRLWVVCIVCQQWNLAPFESRWEAIEESERAFRGTRLRASTSQIGLARLRDGTELVRIGEPLRPEFAAWRYGERFAARWRIRGRVAAAFSGAATLTKGFGGFIGLQVAVAPMLAVVGVVAASNLLRRTITATRVQLASGETVRLTRAHVDRLIFRRAPSVEDGWRMEFPYEPTRAARVFRRGDPIAVLTGAAARAAAIRLLPQMNRGGGARRTVADAVSILERHGTPDAVMRFAGQFTEPEERPDPTDPFGLDEDAGTPLLRRAPLLMPPAVRLAAEMAVHEETERLALAGHLEGLESAWREAEEVAAIADNLTLPASLLRMLEQLRLR